MLPDEATNLPDFDVTDYPQVRARYCAAYWNPRTTEAELAVLDACYRLSWALWAARRQMEMVVPPQLGSRWPW